MINEYLMGGDNADIIYLNFSKAFVMVSYNHLYMNMKILHISKSN